MWFYILSGFYGMTALLRSKETKEDTYIKNGMSKLNAPANASADTIPEVPFAFPGEGSFGTISSNIKTLGTFFGENAIQSESAKYQTNKTLNDMKNSNQNTSGITVKPIHVVQKGETIDDVSNKYGVSKKGILDSNKWLQNRGIKPGDKVVIPKQFDLDELRKLDARMPSQGIIGDPAVLFSGKSFQNPLQTQEGVLNDQEYIPRYSDGKIYCGVSKTESTQTVDLESPSLLEKLGLTDYTKQDVNLSQPRWITQDAQSSFQNDATGESFLESLGLPDMHKQYGYIYDFGNGDDDDDTSCLRNNYGLNFLDNSLNTSSYNIGTSNSFSVANYLNGGGSLNSAFTLNLYQNENMTVSLGGNSGTGMPNIISFGSIDGGFGGGLSFLTPMGGFGLFLGFVFLF